MGLMDVLRGMSNGPRGQPAPSAQHKGMSPLTIPLLGMLAYKAFKGGGPFSNTNPNAPGGSVRPANQPGSVPGAGAGGGLSDLLRGGLGGLLAGGAMGSILNGGLGELMKQFQQSGQADIANSWVGNGPNKPVGRDDLANALGADTLDSLAEHTGMSRDDVLEELQERLPTMVDSLTPHGRIPLQEEFSRMA
jgi:uncharacterized protein YidB (DUF937 family)